MVDADAARALRPQIDAARAAGVNFLDTAEMYPVPPRAPTYARTEEIIGNWFRRTGKRDQWILASKVAGGPVDFIRNGSYAQLRQETDGFIRVAGLTPEPSTYANFGIVWWIFRTGYQIKR